MKTFLTTLLTFFLLSVSASAAERVDLTAPDQVKAGTSVYMVKELNFDWFNKTVVIVLRGSAGEHKEIVYGENEGSVAMLKALNKANLSVKSLHRRVMDRLLADGHLAGSISGQPD